MGAKKVFALFSVWATLGHIYMLQKDHQKGNKIYRLNIQKRKEVPAGSNSLAMRVDVMYFMSISF